VLNLALEKGVISNALFAALVLMALVTTFMTGHSSMSWIRRIASGSLWRRRSRAKRSPRNLRDPDPDRSILLAPQTDVAVSQILAIAEPLARRILLESSSCCG
jgi:hypothetical protein